jgi:hypothetical protein
MAACNLPKVVSIILAIGARRKNIRRGREGLKKSRNRGDWRWVVTKSIHL